MKYSRTCAVYGRDLISEVRRKNVQLFASWILVGISLVLNIALAVALDGGCQ